MKTEGLPAWKYRKRINRSIRQQVWWWLTCRHHTFSEGGAGASNFAGRACNTCGAPSFLVRTKLVS